MTRDHFADLLLTPSITGARAVFYTLVAAGVPTFVRAGVSGFVSGCELTIYLPFVLLAAVFLGWKHGVATALISTVLAQFVVMGTHHSFLASACSIYSLAVFALGSAMIIVAVQGLRLIASRVDRQGLNGSSDGGIVFSLEKGQAWASWYGQESHVQLGPQGEVAEMMEDFLAQLEVGKRLNRSSG